MLSAEHIKRLLSGRTSAWHRRLLNDGPTSRDARWGFCGTSKREFELTLVFKKARVVMG